MRHPLRRLALLLALVTAVVIGAAPAALACGSLVAPNGAVQLLRTTTLAAHHDGVEHYLTNFEFASAEQSFGSIIPLPGKPTKVERAGDWTLQRLRQEVAPPAEAAFDSETQAAPAAGRVEVIERTRIDSLDVTIVKGGGPEVAEWAAGEGFTLTDDTPEVLDFYAERSPFFMTAKFDAAAAAEDGFAEGDGVPVHLTIPVDDPWVPLRILSTGKPAEEVVQADVFLLTDVQPELLAGPGLTLARSEPASDLLLDDLRSDKNMGWVPSDAWLTYLQLDAEAGDLSYDLATDVSGNTPDIIDTGVTSVDQLAAPGGGLEGDAGWSPGLTAGVTGAAILAVALAVATGGWFARARRQSAVEEMR